MTVSVCKDAKRIVIKVGSTLVTNHGEGLDKEAINRWAVQVAQLRAAGKEAVSYTHLTLPTILRV